VKTVIFCTCRSNNWETVEDGWVHSAAQFVSIELSFHSCKILSHSRKGVPGVNKNMVKIAIFGLTHSLKHRMTRKLLKIDRYMLQEVWQASNCLSIYVTFSAVVAEASPGQTKM